MELTSLDDIVFHLIRFLSLSSLLSPLPFDPSDLPTYESFLVSFHLSLHCHKSQLIMSPATTQEKFWGLTDTEVRYILLAYVTASPPVSVCSISKPRAFSFPFINTCL